MGFKSTKNSRASIALSGLWLLFVAIFTIYEYVNIDSSFCNLSQINTNFREFRGAFFHCNVFSDIDSVGWSSLKINNGIQTLELKLYRLSLFIVLPVLTISFVIVILPIIWRWVFKTN